MKVIHGRKGEDTEFMQIDLQKPRINVVAQKSGPAWFLYLIKPGKGGAVRTVSSSYETSEDARFALDVAAETLSKYQGM